MYTLTLKKKIVFLLAQTVKNLPANAGELGSIPDREDPLEKEMATHSSTFAWKIPWTGEPGRIQFMGHKESDMTERLIYIIDIIILF